jgi:NAD+ kinase
MKKIAILTNYTKDPDHSITRQIADYICSRGGDAWIPDFRGGLGYDSNKLAEDDAKFMVKDLTDLPEDTECAITLGGDGTLLQAARMLLGKNVPLFGINLGNLGFLTSASRENMTEGLDALLDDAYIVDERTMLHGKVLERADEEEDSEKQIVMESTALNDIVVARSGFSRLVDLKIYVNDNLMNIYGADGLIISTATGSTGYNLSAGGPIVMPQADVMIVTPICPHSLQARSIVVPGTDRIRVSISKRHKTQEEEAVCTFDGQIGQKLGIYGETEICKAQETARILRIRGMNPYQILQKKINSF